MDDKELGRWLREELPLVAKRLGCKADHGTWTEYDALTALVALLREAEKYVWRGEVRARLRTMLGGQPCP